MPTTTEPTPTLPGLVRLTRLRGSWPTPPPATPENLQAQIADLSTLLAQAVSILRIMAAAQTTTPPAE